MVIIINWQCTLLSCWFC